MTTDVRVAHRRVLAAVAVGGGAGAAARYGVAQLLPAEGVPWHTLGVNVAGCMAMGVLVTVFAGERHRHPLARPLLVTGVVGAFTTYSTFAVETLVLWRDGTPAAALWYALASIVGGCAAVWLGALVVRRLLRRSR